MDQTIEAMNIYQRVHAISSEIGKVSQSLSITTKTDKNGKPVASYKAISINDVVDSALPLLTKYRVMVYPVDKEIIDAQQITTTTQYGEKTNFFVRMKCTYRFVNIDKPDEYFDVIGYGDGIDSGDKSNGKANTYARKYCLIDALNLSKGEDPDEKLSEEYKSTATTRLATDGQVDMIMKMYDETGLNKILAYYKVNALRELSIAQASEIIEHAKKK